MAIKIKPRVIYKDRGFAEIVSKMHQLGNKRVQVGVLEPHASSPHPLRKNITIGEVAVINEYGSDAAGVPERSFIRRAFRTKAGRSLLVEQLRQAVLRVVKGGSPVENALAPAGHRLVGAVQDAILRSPPPPNAPWTIEEKGHDQTLVHTYTLHDSISSRVVAVGRGSRDPNSGGGLNLGGGNATLPGLPTGQSTGMAPPDSADADAQAGPPTRTDDVGDD